MREIKFRAWNGTLMLAGIPLVSGKIWSNPHGKNDYMQISSSEADYEDGSHWILMQYTGLKDRNGTEIYEGDIVHTDYFKDNGWNTKVFTGNEPIVFEAGCFRMGDFSTLDECTSNSEYKLEVIGNIYENPELLK